jgi:hypothetical protein
MNKQKHLGINKSGDFIAFGGIDKEISIWNLSGKKISSLSSNISTGGNRLVISGNGKFIATSDFEYGIEKKSTLNEIIWTRNDLLDGGSLTLLYEKWLFSAFDYLNSSIISFDTGQTIFEFVEKVKHVYEFENHLVLVETYENVSLFDCNNLCFLGLKIEKETFAILNVSITSSCFLISYSGGIVCTYDKITFKIINRFKFEENYHLLSSTYIPEIDLFFGLIWNYMDGGEKILVSFSPNLAGKKEINSFDYNNNHKFLFDGNYFVDTRGEMRNTIDGSIKLNFW